MVAVLCDPFAEEKKHTQRALAEMGRALAEAGIGALHCDYRGTGDSGGSFEQYTLDDWRDDICAAVDYLRLRHCVGRVALLGLRLGANLAREAAVSCHACELVMWEPILEGERYVQELNQRHTIRRMLTKRTPGAGPNLESRERGFIDLDGYRLGPTLHGQLRDLTLAATAPYEQPALLMQCNARAEVTPAAETALQHFPRGQARAVAVEPFWQRIGLTDTAPLARATLDWLTTLGEANAPSGPGSTGGEIPLCP
jgi:exosortase A-associated hydrolase 2